MYLEVSPLQCLVWYISRFMQAGTGFFWQRSFFGRMIMAFSVLEMRSPAWSALHYITDYIALSFWFISFCYSILVLLPPESVSW